jgi:glycosyltransferase involved in cell wall biosynthesis
MNNPIRVGLLQRVLPVYRVPFFDTLANVCSGGLAVFAGQMRHGEMIETAASLNQAVLTCGHNLYLFSGRQYLCWQQGLTRWLREWNPDVLIVDTNPRHLSTPHAIRWMRERNKKVIGWGLGAPGSGVLRNFVRTSFMRQFDALITYSRQGAGEYAALGYPEEHIFVAPNAVTPRPTHPSPIRPEPLQGKPTLLFVGRLQARKRVDMLIRACAALPEEWQPRLHIVGDGPVRVELEALAARLYPMAHFFGALHGEALDALFLEADVFVLPGTGGLAVQQAMSYGLPVMVGEADGTQSDLVNPQNGWQLPAGDLLALVEAIQQALSDIPRLRRMGEESYRIVHDQINLENMVDVFRLAISAVSAR